MKQPTKTKVKELDKNFCGNCPWLDDECALCELYETTVGDDDTLASRTDDCKDAGYDAVVITMTLVETE